MSELNNKIDEFVEWAFHFPSYTKDEYREKLCALITEQVRLARDSERNRVLAELRHFGYKHDAKKMMKLRKEWDAAAAQLKDTTLLEEDTDG